MHCAYSSFMAITSARPPRSLVDDKIYGYACDGLLVAIANACDPNRPLFSAYYGNAIDVAVWHARYVYRQARRRGDIPAEAW